MLQTTYPPSFINFLTSQAQTQKFGCRLSVTVAEKGGLPPATMSLQTPLTSKEQANGVSNLSYFRFPLQHNISDGAKGFIPQKATVEISSRVNTPSDWLSPRHPQILAGINTGQPGTQDLFLGKPWRLPDGRENTGHREDLMRGALAHAYNDHSMPIAVITGKRGDTVQVHDIMGNETQGASLSKIEEMRRSLVQLTQKAIQEGSRAMLLHQRYITRGKAVHQFEAEIDGIKMGFAHNGSVDRVQEFDNKTTPIYQEASSAKLKEHAKRPVGQLFLDVDDRIAWETKNDSYRYFLLILANLKEIAGGTLNARAFSDHNVALAISQAGLEMAKGAPAEHPMQENILPKNRTYYQGVGYAGTFYLTRPDGSSFIMVMEGNKSLQLGMFYDPVSGKRILKADAEGSQPVGALTDPALADQWLQLPKGSGIVITSKSNTAEQRATVPFDLQSFVNRQQKQPSTNALPKTLSFKDLPEEIKKTRPDLPELKVNPIRLNVVG